MADQEVTTATYVPNPQELPEYLSYSTYVTTIGNTVYTTQTIIQLPQTYYGPSIPLGEGWTFGGSSSPPITPTPITLTSGATNTGLPDEPSGTDDGITTAAGNTPSPIIPISITASPTSEASIGSSSTPTAAPTTTLPTPSSSSPTSAPTSSAPSPPPISTSSTSTSSSTSSSPNKGLSTPALILATILPITAFFLIIVGVLLWRNRNRRDRTRERSGRGGGRAGSGRDGGSGRSRGVYGIVGRKRTRGDRAGGDKAIAGEDTGVGGGSIGRVGGGGGGGEAGLAGGAGVSRSMVSGRDDDDGDARVGGHAADVNGGNRGGRRWLPTLLAATGLRQRSASARLKHQNRVASTNVWGDASDDDDNDGFEMIDLPGRLPGNSAEGMAVPSTRTRQAAGEDEIDDQERTPRASLNDADLASVRTGRRGMDDSRGDLGLEELAPFMGDVTPTKSRAGGAGKGKGKGKFMAVLGIGAGRSREERDDREDHELKAANTGDDTAEAELLPMATMGREPKISQTDSSTPSSRQGFFPVGTAAKKQSRRAQEPSDLERGHGEAPGKRGHVKSDSFPSVAGGNDLFYSYPAENSEHARQPDTARLRTDSGVAHEGSGGEEMLRSSSGSRFSILYPEEYSSGSAGSRRGQGQSQQFVSEQDLAALGMPLPIPAGRFDAEGDGARTPNSYRSAQSQLRFPVPPDRSREPSVLGQVGVLGVMEGVTRSFSADTSETRYHSLNDQVNTLTRRSRSSATTADDEGDQPGVDEYGRRTGAAAVDGSYGTSSAIQKTYSAQTPVRTGMIEPEDHDLETTPLAGISDRQPRPRLPLSALPSPTSTETPSSWTQPNRFSLIAGSISSLFGAKRASVVSSLTEGEHDPQVQQAYLRRPTSGIQRNNSAGAENRQSYAGQPLVPEEVYREAFLSGIPEAARREARQESSGETRETFGSAGLGSDETGRRELSEGVTSEGDGSGETFGVKSGRDRLGAGLMTGSGLGERARVVTPSTRGNEAARATRGTYDDNPESTTRRIGEFGEVIPGSNVPGREILRLPGEMRKTSTLFIPGSPYSPAQASSQSASVQDEGSKSSSGSQGGSGVSVGTKRSIGTMRSGRSGSTNATGRTGRTGRSEMSEESGESLGVVSGLAPGGIGEAGGMGRVDYSVAAVRGKRSMPQLVNTPDALAGNIPRTDTPPPATVPGPASSNAGTVSARSNAGTLGPAAGALVEDQKIDRMLSTPPPRSRSQSRPTSGQCHVRNVDTEATHREPHDLSADAEEPLLPPQPPFVTKTREESRSASPSRSRHSANSEKRREKEKWWLGRFGKDKDDE